MAFIGVEFSGEEGLAVVSRKWLTPRKREVFWPLVKNQNLYEKAVQRGDTPDEKSWEIYNISRIFFETDDFTKALKKLKRAENTSDLQSEVDDGTLPAKRIRKATRRLFEDSASDDETSSNLLQRPPRINLNNSKSSEITASKSEIFHVVQDGGMPSSSNVSCTTTAYNETSSKPGEDDFMRKVLGFMVYLKEQNSQIIKLLQNNQNNSAFSPTFQLPDDLPANLPLKDASDVIKIEQYLSKNENLTAVSSYFSTLGARDVTSKTNTILKSLITNTLAMEFSFLGTRKEKKAFSALNLKTVVIRAVQSVSPNTLENEINDSIKTWLKHAPQRTRKEQTKNSKSRSSF